MGLLAAIALLSPVTAFADSGFGFHGWGIRGGLSVDPDQFFVGGHIDLGEFAENVQFIPNVTAGFGDHLTIISINPDVSYSFPVEDIGALYVGGLFAFQWIDYESHYLDTDTEVGLHAIAGLELDAAPVFFELNVGIDDTPDLKVAVGYAMPWE
jgi:hypothetical protein